MKSFIFRGTLLVCTLLFSLAFTSCEKDAEIAKDNGAAVNAALVDLDEGVVNDDQVKEFKDALITYIEGEQVNLDAIQEAAIARPDGTVDQVYIVDGDIEVTKKQLQEIRYDNANDIKQYRTNNLVNSPRTISVIGYTGSCCALTTKMRTGLRWAIDNYNRLNIGLTFTLSYSASTNADIVVYNNGQGGGGGSAGFPSNGNPYKWVQINAGTDNYSNNVNEHVIGHEIGHCIGFRHTDFFSRQSCGQNVNEGSAGVGAVHIPGTPTGYDANSLMLACFNSGEDGEFGPFDVVALEYMY